MYRFSEAYKTFKRYKPRYEDDELSFSDGSKLDDIASLTSFANLQVTDLVKLTDEGLHDEDDNFFTSNSNQWYEVVDVDKDGPLVSNEEFNMTIRVVPVDDYGKPLTKAQIRKINPDWADNYEKYGYVDYFEVRKYDDESMSVIPKVLVVNTQEVPNWDYKGKDPSKGTYGYYLDRSPAYGKEELYDDDGNPTGKVERWPIRGDASVRKAAYERQKQANARAKDRADKEAAEEAAFKEKFGILIKAAKSSGTYIEDFIADVKKLYPDADDEDIEIIVNEAKDLRYRRNSMSKDQLVDFCIEAGVDPEVVYIISAGASAAFFNYKKWINED